MTAIRIALSGRATSGANAPVRPLEKPQAITLTGSPPQEHQQDSQFGELYKEYFPKVFAYIYGRVGDKELSLDIVSDVFEKAFIKKQSLRSPEAFGSWLFTIARNEVSSHWRKEKPAAKAMQEAAWENEFHHQPRSPEDTLLHRERIANLSQVIKQLPQREQEIIALKFDAELSNREIADVLKTSEVNVRVTIFRALRKLRDRIQHGGEQ